jgi:hypothetical protein
MKLTEADKDTVFAAALYAQPVFHLNNWKWVNTKVGEERGYSVPTLIEIFDVLVSHIERCSDTTTTSQSGRFFLHFDREDDNWLTICLELGAIELHD